MRYLLIPAAVILMAQAPSVPQSKNYDAAFQVAYCFSRIEMINLYRSRAEAAIAALQDEASRAVVKGIMFVEPVKTGPAVKCGDTLSDVVNMVGAR